MLPWLGLALIILIADQFTKVLILGYYRLGDSTYVTSFFNVVRAHNTGAAFSFLAGASGWQRWFFTAIGVAAAALHRLDAALACGPEAVLLRAGLHPGRRDRQRGGPRCCMATWWTSCSSTGRGWYFPAFNVADSAITVGAVCLILDELLRVRTSKVHSARADRPAIHVLRRTNGV